MGTFRKLFLIFPLTLFLLASYGQVALREWREHFSYNQVQKVVEIGDKIYCSAVSGYFIYNKQDQSVTKVSKASGISDVGISAMRFAEQFQTLVLGYDNGNIDIIRITSDSLINIPFIRERVIVGEKSINSIYIDGHLAYLSTGFGIVVLDLLRREIRDTYQFGEGGSPIRTNMVTIFNGYLYAATIQGIYRAALDSPNLLDFNFWERMEGLIYTNASYRSIVAFNGALYTYFRNPVSNIDELLQGNGTDWQLWSTIPYGYFSNLQVHNNHLAVSVYWDGVHLFNSSGERVQKVSLSYPQDALLDKDNILWVAETNKGLLRMDQKSEHGILPNGPAYNDVKEFAFHDGRLWVSAGNATNEWSGKGVYLFRDEKWSSFNSQNTEGLKDILNLRELLVDRNNPDKLFSGSYGYGFIELEEGEVKVTHAGNSILKTIPGYPETAGVRIAGMNYDIKGNVWLIQLYVESQPVYVLRTDGKWENIRLKSTELNSLARIGDILPTSHGDIWILLLRRGILAFRENPDGTVSEKLFTIRNNDGELIDRLTSIAEDLEGNIWVGTVKGPVIYHQPTNFYDDNNMVNGYQVLIPRKDGSSLADILLENESILCIKVDEANRKWLGTERSGAFLVSPDGKEEIYHFTSRNSPLPSDYVGTIEINDQTGEVFFGTDGGIVSFRGEATTGSSAFSNVYVFPNPVRETYHGDIVITGLMANTNIKITDISGNLVYETTSLGGQAVWNGLNFKGKRVHTGVYLVFCATEDGSETHVAKLLFIR